MTFSYPTRPIRYVVPFGSHGPTQVQARWLVRGLSAALGQPVQIENLPGAGGMTGTELVARAQPNGYTLLAANPGPLTVGPNLRGAPYDPLRDLQPIVLMARLPAVIAVHPRLDAADIAELVELSRRRPLSYASAGVGTVSHLAMESFCHRAAAPIGHVPCEDLPAAIDALVARRVEVAVIPMTDARPLHEQGRLRALAATTLRRAAAWPALPTVDECGVPGFESFNWNGVAAPAGTPRAIVDRINSAVNAMLQDAPARQALVGRGYEPAGGTPEAFAAFLAHENARWAELARAAGLTRQH